MKAKNESNALVKHWKLNHEGMQSPPKFKLGVVTTCRTSLERQIKEAIHINNSDLDILMNSKGEWGINIIPQLKPTEDGDLVQPKTTNNSHIQLINKTVQEESLSEFEMQHKQRRKRRLQQRDIYQSTGNPNNRSEYARSDLDMHQSSPMAPSRSQNPVSIEK